MNLQQIQTMLIVILVGLIGGVINSVLSGGLRWPRRTKLPDNQGTVWDPGWIGTTVTGGAAAFVLWAFGWANPEVPQAYATALLAGVAGGRVLEDQIQKRIFTATTKSLATELAKHIEP